MVNIYTTFSNAVGFIRNAGWEDPQQTSPEDLVKAGPHEISLLGDRRGDLHKYHVTITCVPNIAKDSVAELVDLVIDVVASTAHAQEGEGYPGRHGVGVKRFDEEGFQIV